MVAVYLANGLYGPFVERFELLVQLFFVLKVMGDGLVHQLVAKNHRFVLVASGDALPDVAEELLTALAFKEPRIAVAVVDVIARLTARTVVHVENQVESVGTAPTHHIVDTLETIMTSCHTHVILIRKQLVIEWQADGIGTCTGYEVDIITGDIVVFELPPEVGCCIGTHHLAEHQVDHPC